MSIQFRTIDLSSGSSVAVKCLLILLWTFLPSTGPTETPSLSLSYSWVPRTTGQVGHQRSRVWVYRGYVGCDPSFVSTSTRVFFFREWTEIGVRVNQRPLLLPFPVRLFRWGPGGRVVRVTVSFIYGRMKCLLGIKVATRNEDYRSDDKTSLRLVSYIRTSLTLLVSDHLSGSKGLDLRSSPGCRVVDGDQ